MCEGNHTRTTNFKRDWAGFSGSISRRDPIALVLQVIQWDSGQTEKWNPSQNAKIIGGPDGQRMQQWPPAQIASWRCGWLPWWLEWTYSLLRCGMSRNTTCLGGGEEFCLCSLLVWLPGSVWLATIGYRRSACEEMSSTPPLQNSKVFH